MTRSTPSDGLMMVMMQLHNRKRVRLDGDTLLIDTDLEPARFPAEILDELEARRWAAITGEGETFRVVLTPVGSFEYRRWAGRTLGRGRFCLTTKEAHPDKQTVEGAIANNGNVPGGIRSARVMA